LRQGLGCTGESLAEGYEALASGDSRASASESVVLEGCVGRFEELGGYTVGFETHAADGREEVYEAGDAHRAPPGHADAEVARELGVAGETLRSWVR
jgi:hypothetical protein